MIEERIVLQEFIDWCVNTDRTEWLGYYEADKRVLEEYFKYKKELSDKMIELIIKV